MPNLKELPQGILLDIHENGQTDGQPENIMPPEAQKLTKPNIKTFDPLVELDGKSGNLQSVNEFFGNHEGLYNISRQSIQRVGLTSPKHYHP